MSWPQKSRLRKCSICRKRFNLIDWANHQGAHLSPEERDRLVREMIENKRKKPLPPEKEVFKGFTEEDK